MGVDVIDYTFLQKRGLIKKQVTEDDAGVLDLTKKTKDSNVANEPVSPSPLANFFDTDYSDLSGQKSVYNNENDVKAKLDELSSIVAVLLRKIEGVEERLRLS